MPKKSKTGSGRTWREAFDVIQKAIDDECAPERLSKQDYLELLEELSSDLEGRIEAAREELKELK